MFAEKNGFLHEYAVYDGELIAANGSS